MIVELDKKDIEKVLLFDDGIMKYIIYLFKDGSSRYAPMTADIIANTSKAGITMISVKELA